MPYRSKGPRTEKILQHQEKAGELAKASHGQSAKEACHAAAQTSGCQEATAREEQVEGSIRLPKGCLCIVGHFRGSPAGRGTCRRCHHGAPCPSVPRRPAGGDPALRTGKGCCLGDGTCAAAVAGAVAAAAPSCGPFLNHNCRTLPAGVIGIHLRVGVDRSHGTEGLEGLRISQRGRRAESSLLCTPISPSGKIVAAWCRRILRRRGSLA